MGFSYRKSFKAGPIRITASKSGISYSAGVRGARVTKRADGRVQTTLSAPGTGLRYTTTSGREKRTTRPAPKPAPAGPSKAELQATYRTVYTHAVQQLRDGHTAAELRGQLHAQDTAHRQVLKAITDAEKYLTGEAQRQAMAEQWARAAEAKRHADAATAALVAQAAQQLLNGVPRHQVATWLKEERRVRFMDRGGILSKAKKINKGRP